MRVSRGGSLPKLSIRGKKLTITGSRRSFKICDSAAVEENEEPKNRWQVENDKKIGHKRIYEQLTEFPTNSNKQIGIKTVKKSKRIDNKHTIWLVKAR